MRSLTDGRFASLASARPFCRRYFTIRTITRSSERLRSSRTREIIVFFTTSKRQFSCRVKKILVSIVAFSINECKHLPNLELWASSNNRHHDLDLSTTINLFRQFFRSERIFGLFIQLHSVCAMYTRKSSNYIITKKNITNSNILIWIVLILTLTF